MNIPNYPKDILRTSDFDTLREKNKNLSEVLSRVCKISMDCLDGETTINELQDVVNEANETILGNSVVLIDFPSFLKKKYIKNLKLSVEEVIEIYNNWNK